MSLVEINFDGIVGPSHNYAGLSVGNVASAKSAGQVSHPRAAALQGIAKMRANLALGLKQGILLPHDRPNDAWLARLGETITSASATTLAQALSASPMWAANAATVSPAPDTPDGRCHLTVANLSTMAHRSHEAEGALAQLRIAFADPGFVLHPPVPATFGDEGAANHMRLSTRHGEPGVEVFVYGERGGPYPARQRYEASLAVARLHRVDALFARQSDEAIAAGAFHNDVVAVANENVLFAHAQAFADKEALYAALAARVPSFEIVEVPAEIVSLERAIKTYLFNAQLVTLPEGGMALVLPSEAQEDRELWRWLERLADSNSAIRRLVLVDVRESMANGGGPACLRLRVVADPAKIDARFLVDEAKLERLAQIVERHWPEQIAPSDLRNPALHQDIRHARAALLDALDLAQLA